MKAVDKKAWWTDQAVSYFNTGNTYATWLCLLFANWEH